MSLSWGAVRPVGLFELRDFILHDIETWRNNVIAST
jgi:hypothetical protein